MESMKPCPACGHSLSADAEFCPHCGKPFRERHGVFYYVCAVVGSLVVLGIIAAVLYGVLVVAPAKAAARRRADLWACENNLNSIGKAFRMWSMDHADAGYPFCLSTTNGGTLELCRRDTNGVDLNSLVHFLVVSNELYGCRDLVCPANYVAGRFYWTNFTQAEVTYHLHTARQTETSSAILAYCPEHRLALRCDGSVQRAYKSEAEEESEALAEEHKEQTAKQKAEKERQAEEAAAMAKYDNDLIERIASNVHDTPRTWTYQSGLTVRGKFVGFQQPGRIIIRDDLGPQDYSLEVQKLCETDRRIAAKLAQSP